jgi:pseudomonalisin/xanthomonalisin
MADLRRMDACSQHTAMHVPNLQESVMPSNLRLKVLVVAMGLAAGTAAFAATPSTVLAATTVVTRATALRTGDVVTGAMALTQNMRVTLSLHLRNEARLDAFIANPHHPNLSHAEVVAKYGPSQAQVDQVKAFMRQQGFTNIQVTPDNLLVSGEASVAIVQRAFHTHMVNVRTKHGRMAFANSTEARIPNGLNGVVNEVLGLQNVHRFHVLAHTQATGSATGHNPTQFAAIYNAGSTATASGINVGIITQGSMANVQNDFKSFLSQNGLPSIPMNVVKVDGGGSDTSGDGEWDLDSQDIVGISGGVKALYLYDTASLTTQDLVDDFSAAESANVVRVVNVSIGGCETGSETNGAATGDSVFKAADAEGMTFSVSSGDSGADECGDGGTTPSWPADSQYVVAVGGTELYTSGSTWENETVWNNLSSNEGATGGSPSTFEAMPSWQQNVGQNAGHTTRGVPDVAFDASPVSGATVIVDGATQQIGGTSLASPLFVGVWARTLAANPNLGFAAPLIYADAASHYASDFHDVTSGNNSGETAAVGWDYTTGFGSINIANFVANVAGGGGVSPPPPPPPPPTGGTFSNNTVYPIADNATVTSQIGVTGESGDAPSNLPVHVNITHNWSGDLEIVLYAPNGAYAILQYPDYNNDGNIDKTYSVNASSVLADGTWKLKVIDDDVWGDGGDYGTLNGWNMTF